LRRWLYDRRRPAHQRPEPIRKQRFDKRQAALPAMVRSLGLELPVKFAADAVPERTIEAARKRIG
jgi:hypothetical protein